MARSVEWFLLVTSVVVGLSHIFYTAAWGEVFASLHRAGRGGAFANGALSLVPGAAVVAGHPVWSGPAAVLTAFGWLLVAKGAICLLAPDRALASMAVGATGRGFRAGGVILLAVALYAGYCLWAGRDNR
jgi:hypothetical protein